MNRLVKLQLRNVLHNKLLYVCTGITLLLQVVLPFVLSLFVKFESSTPNLVFPQILSIIQFEPGLVSMMFIAIFTCLDFNEGTTKNIIGRGYTRTQLLFSKYIVSLIGIGIMIAVSSFAVFALYISNGFGFEINMLWVTIVSLFSIIANTVFYVTLSFVLEKNSSAIIGCIFIPRVLDMVFPLLGSKLGVDVSGYWVSGIITGFANNPSALGMIIPIVLLVGYTALFICLGTQIMYKREIK